VDDDDDDDDYVDDHDYSYDYFYHDDDNDGVVFVGGYCRIWFLLLIIIHTQPTSRSPSNAKVVCSAAAPIRTRVPVESATATVTTPRPRHVDGSPRMSDISSRVTFLQPPVEPFSTGTRYLCYACQCRCGALLTRCCSG
jgi:hypothetical protein